MQSADQLLAREVAADRPEPPGEAQRPWRPGGIITGGYRKWTKLSELMKSGAGARTDPFFAIRHKP